MLNAEQTKQIATFLKIDETVFTNALKDTAEVAIEIPTGLTVVTEPELTRVKDAEYNRGKTVGIEVAVKEVKEKLALDFTGKTIEGLLEASNKKVLADAKIEPDKKVTELQKDIDVLRTTNQTLQQQVTDKDSAVTKANTERELFRQIPTLGEKAPAIDKVVKLMSTDGYDFKLENGVMTAYKDGEAVKDNLAKVIPVKDVITGYAKENNLISDAKPAEGRGGGDGNKTPIYTKMSEVKAAFVAEGKSLAGVEFSDKIVALKKENADFDMNG